MELSKSKYKNMFPVVGDSMSPTLMPGDFISIDEIKDDAAKADNLYLVLMNGSLDVKRLVFGIEGKNGRGVLFKTDSDHYDDYVLSYSEVEQCVQIIGSVAFIFRAMRPSEAANYGLLQSVSRTSRLN